MANYATAQHDHAPSKQDSSKAKPKSPRQVAMTNVGNNHVHVDYGSPSVRNRVIWNGLVSFGQVWATGAHKATWIDFSKDVTINGKMIPAGKYGFFTIPNKKKWTLILNKVWDMHLADDYDESQDMIRVEVKPKKNKKLVEALTYEVLAKNDKSGSIRMSWENLNVSLDFKM